MQHVQSSENTPQQNQQIGILAAYSSPLPPAEQLEIYEKVYPGAAKAIFAAFTAEQKHRHEKENRETEADIASIKEFNEQENKRIKADFYGLISGAAICVLSLCVCIALAILKVHPAAIPAVVAVPLASIIKALRGK